MSITWTHCGFSTFNSNLVSSWKLQPSMLVVSEQKSWKRFELKSPVYLFIFIAISFYGIVIITCLTKFYDRRVLAAFAVSFLSCVSPGDLLPCCVCGRLWCQHLSRSGQSPSVATVNTFQWKNTCCQSYISAAICNISQSMSDRSEKRRERVLLYDNVNSNHRHNSDTI